eukprot:COSAG01_NODE_10190_length_2225_cov_138.809031_2_plen_78_part_00
MDFIHRRQTRQSRDEEIDNFVSIHKKSSWSGMIIAAKSVYFLSTPLKSVYILSNPLRPEEEDSAKLLPYVRVHVDSS